MERPDDEAVVPLADTLRSQREYALERGSPVMALVLAALAEDIERDRPLARLVPERVRFGDYVGLRLAAVVHRLALSRRAPAVALHLPTLGGTPPIGRAAEVAFGRAVVEALLAHPDDVRAGLSAVPQTNDPGRAVVLRAVLSRVPGDVHLRELGTSAGLHLRSDHLPGIAALEAGPMPRVLSREGVDRHPIDLATPEGRELLSSYIWVDDVDRFARLGRAFEVAARVPARLVPGEIADFAEGLSLVPGSTLVVWHSAVWPYLDARTRERVDAAIAGLAARVTPEARLVTASWEWEPGPMRSLFVATMREWTPDGPRERVLARGPSHGGPEVHPA